MIVDEHNTRRDREEDDALIQAYTIASLQRVKKLPNLNNLLEEQRKRRKLKQQPQTAEQMLAKVMRMQAKFSREEK